MHVLRTFCDWIVGICDATTNNMKSASQRTGAKNRARLQRHGPAGRVAKEQLAPKSGFTLVYVGRIGAGEKPRASAQCLSARALVHAGTAAMDGGRWQ